MCLKSIVLSSLFESVESLAPGLDSLAGVSGYLGLSSVDRTTEEVVPSPCQPPSQLGPEGAGARGQQGNSEKALFSCGAASPGHAPPAPSLSAPLRARAAD